MSNNTVRLVVLSTESFGAELERQAQELQPGFVVFKDLIAFMQARQVLMEKSFDEEHIFLSQASELDQATLNALVKVLKSGGNILITTKSNELDAGVQKRLTFAGLTGLENISSGVFRVTRKVWKQEQKQETFQSQAQPKNAFAAALEQNGAAEKVDPEALLTNDLITEADIGGSCDTKPKACKNCSCGRKEMEEQGLDPKRIKDLEAGNIKSSCGNCYLGDAFRCASCPYKGLPSFEAGDKVKLDLNKLDLGEQSEVAFKVDNGGKVKINF